MISCISCYSLDAVRLMHTIPNQACMSWIGPFIQVSCQINMKKSCCRTYAVCTAISATSIEWKDISAEDNSSTFEKFSVVKLENHECGQL